MAEEKYLIEPGASLGTWFARVQETICVACRVMVKQLDEGRPSGAADLAGEQLGLLADVCAEAIRAAAQARPGGDCLLMAREEPLLLLAEGDVSEVAERWPDVFVLIARCAAALEPLANGLRGGDLQFAAVVDQADVSECFLRVAAWSFVGVYALC